MMRIMFYCKRYFLRTISFLFCFLVSTVLLADTAPDLSDPSITAAINAALQEQKAGNMDTPVKSETRTNIMADNSAVTDAGRQMLADNSSTADQVSQNPGLTQPSDTQDAPAKNQVLPPPVPGSAPFKADIAADADNLMQSPDQSQQVTPSTRLWNLQDADILSVINEVSQETGKNFVVDPRVTGKISLVSSKPLRKDQVYSVFLSVLELLGYSAIPSGSVVKIVPNMESGEMATRVATSMTPGHGDEVVVRVIPLNNVSATQLIPVLRPLMPQWSNISAYTPGNVLILLGRADNLRRMAEIIRDVDQASNNSIQIVHLTRASAVQVAQVLTNLQAAARASGEPSNVSIAVDDRSNSILLSGSKAVRLRMRVLIAQLDAPAAAAEGNTEVIYLRYLEAKTFAPLLGKIALNILGKGQNDLGSAPVPSSSSYSSGSSSGSSSSMSSSSGSGSNSGTRSTASTPENNTSIQAEPNSNAIIITAPPTLMKALKTIVAKLDIRPAQVLVEAIIAEVDEDSLQSLGIQWGSVESSGSVTPTSTGLATSFPPLGAGVVGIMPSTQIKAVLTVLQTVSGVDILSTPSIVVLDNQKATIEVGQDVPMQTGSYTSGGAANAAGTVTPFTTIENKPVTLKLDVTPQLNLGHSVRLKLDLKNDTLRNPQNPTLTPIINTSKISNSVIINSEDVLVLGGLISNANIDNVNKVPILGNLPIVGSLFQQKTSNQQKRNLMVFIKPVIMRSDVDSMYLTQDKYYETRSTQANYQNVLQDIGNEPLEPMLPPWKNNSDLPTPFETPPQ